MQLHERNIIISTDHHGPMELSYHNLINLLERSHPLFHMGLLLLCGYVGGKIANLLKTPRVSGYIVTGMLLSPSILGVFHEDLVKDDLAIITDMALGIVQEMRKKECWGLRFHRRRTEEMDYILVTSHLPQS